MKAYKTSRGVILSSQVIGILLTKAGSSNSPVVQIITAGETYEYYRGTGASAQADAQAKYDALSTDLALSVLDPYA